MITTTDINLILLQKPELVFFGLVAAAIDKRIIQSKDDNITAYTDGKQIVFVCPEETKLDIYVGLALHELLHIISSHLERKGNRDPIVWNIACDHTCNRAILEMLPSKYIRLPKGFIFFKEIEQEFPNISAEDLYDLLLKRGIVKFCRIVLNANGAEVIDCNGNKVPYDIEKISPNLKIDIETARNCKLLAQSIAMNEGNLEGMTARVKRRIKKILDIVIPWDEILVNVLRNAISDDVTKTWSKKNLICPHLKIPGNFQNYDKVETLIIAIDTSGSISDGQLEKFAAAVAQSAQYYKKVIVMLHNVSTYEILYENKPTKDKLHNWIVENTEEGGTSHLNTFWEIGKIIEDGQYSISSIVFLTDFESNVHIALETLDGKFDNEPEPPKLKPGQIVFTGDGFAEVGDEPLLSLDEIKRTLQWLREYETIWLINKSDEEVQKIAKDYSKELFKFLSIRG